MTITAEAIESARAALAPVITTTPMEKSRQLTQLAGGDVYLKCENLQRTGSFKIRGAYHRIRSLDAETRARGVVAASAGNHAQGVALASQLLGAHATIYMPSAASTPKVNATRDYGAEVSLGGLTVSDALAAAMAHRDETGAEFIHPFDHPDVVVGQATLGLEILDQLPQVKTIVVPTGGGGLLAGVAAAVRVAAPHVRVIGVQAQQAAAYPPSLEAGRPVTINSVATMADGIAVPTPGGVPFDVISRVVDRVVTVSETDLSRALVWLLERAKLVVEPAGAASVAAVPQLAPYVEFPMVPILSGGNVDPQVMMRVIRHGLNSAGRFMQVRVDMADKPGALVKLLSVLASLETNVLDIVHSRTGGPGVSVDHVAVAVELETRGPAHRDSVLAGLSQAGYDVAQM